VLKLNEIKDLTLIFTSKNFWLHAFQERKGEFIKKAPSLSEEAI
jgi:hypothetical protein